MSRYFFSRETLGSDVAAGLTVGFFSIPDGLATGLLAAVNPIHGVYAYMVGTFTGALTTSSVYMTVQATSAMALIVASVPQISAGPRPTEHLFMLSILTGIIMAVLGVLKLGSLLRFVPKSVMTGFINAVAVLIVLGQLGSFTGYAAEGPNRIAQTLNLLLNLEGIDRPSLAVGVFTIILILLLERTKLKSFGIVAALLVASLLPPLFNWETVTVAGDIADIPTQLPGLSTFDLSTIIPMLLPALSLALVGLVQGAGISQAYANPDGKYGQPSGDFIGQGIANIASGMFQGMPVGGSLSATSLSVNSGARTRFANIVAGVTMAVSLLLFASLIRALAMPALAGLLIVIGFRTLRLDDVRMVWNIGLVQQAVALITFITALFVPLQYAVLMGVALSILLYVFQQSNKLVVKEWVYEPGQFPVEKPVPKVLASDKITVLMPYGSLFFASAQGFESQLPALTPETRNAVVIIRLRGHNDLGTTFLTVLASYAKSLQKNECRLLLSGVSRETLGEFEKTGLVKVFKRKNIFKVTDQVGESLQNAYAEAEKWLETVSEKTAGK